MSHSDELEGENTVVESSRRDTLNDIIPDAPAVPPIEIVFDREVLMASAMPGSSPPHTLEIWTLNRVYTVDSTMTCIEVRDRTSGLVDSKHLVLGARLAGGQRRYDKTLHFTRPFPVPGTEAIFQRDGKRTPASVTSKVERLLMRIRVTSIIMDEHGAWEDVTNAFLGPHS